MNTEHRLNLPAGLERLQDVAYNLRWTWDHEAIDLFQMVGGEAWRTSGHNPVAMLQALPYERLEAAAASPEVTSRLARVAGDLRAYLTSGDTWYRTYHPSTDQPLAAYFSAEFGLTESLSIFAGGLGILAGDHLKSASDLGLPLVGVGLLYQCGYFRQQIDASGWQRETYEDNDFNALPLVLETDGYGAPLTVGVAFPGRTVYAQVWRAQVGRVPLYLLDSNLEQNEERDRGITRELYGGDTETRIQQEMLLGIGGYRALQALGLAPAVCHMNEGHSAFLTLEHIRHTMRTAHVAFREAAELTVPSMVFTTHTPVAAGHDYFSPELMARYFGPYADEMGVSLRELMSLGRTNPDDESEYFCMTVLAIRLSSETNGVSKLHGAVSRDMWHKLWPGLPEQEVPIQSITNGVHLCSWVAPEMSDFYSRHLRERWHDRQSNPDVWAPAEQMPSEHLWSLHSDLRRRLVEYARCRVRNQMERTGASEDEILGITEGLNPAALTIGFARRFATYKRAALLLHDPARLARLLNDPDKPVQFIFSGKAHPKDEGGKQLIRRILEMSLQEPFRGKIVFLEDYTMSVARYLVQGSDVWLNNPQRPLEASGTSGMKAAANGALNASTLDGWWDEAWKEFSGSRFIGWTIGTSEELPTAEQQEVADAEALYALLEQQIVPAFYERNESGVPERWVSYMKSSIAMLPGRFNTDRMVREYTERLYIPALGRAAYVLERV